MSGDSLVGLAGVFVAGLALWLTYRERRSAYRELLYSKQIEGCVEIVQAAQQVVQGMYFLIEAVWHGGYREVIEAAQSKLDQDLKHFDATQTKWVLVLYPQVQEAVDRFRTQILEATTLLFNPPDPQSEPYRNVPVEAIPEPQSMTGKAYASLIASCRERLRVPSLSRETLQLLGTAPRSLRAARSKNQSSP